jgi:Methyltransferase domain
VAVVSRFVHLHHDKTGREYAPSFFDQGWINAAHERIVDSVDAIEGKLAVEDQYKLYEAGYFARGTIVEIGRFCARSTVILAIAARDAGHASAIYSIDHSPKMVGTAMSNLKTFGLSDAATLIQGDSAVQLSRIPGPFDTVFVDGDHSFAGVQRDLEALVPHLRAGSVILFHDYYHRNNETGIYGVARAVNEMAPVVGLEFRGRFGAIALYEQT